jgi:hypothetical protein
MKHLKKFNESKNDSEIYDKEDLESITRIVLDLENLIFDNLGIEIEKSDNFSRGLEENQYFISFYPERTIKELLPDRLQNKDVCSKISVLFKISVSDKSELEELIEHYFDGRLKQEGYEFQKEINKQIIPASTYQQYKQYYYFSYLIDI